MIGDLQREPGESNGLLLADDDIVLGETLGRALSSRGFDVRIAASEATALQLAAEKPPRHAVIDLKLGDRSGLDLISKLIGLDPRVRIVILTAYGNIATAIEAIKRGATYYLCKPASADAIVAALHHEVGCPVIPAKTTPMSIKRLEWEHIAQVLHDNNGNISCSARALSMHRRTLQRKLAKRPVRD